MVTRHESIPASQSCIVLPPGPNLIQDSPHALWTEYLCGCIDIDQDREKRGWKSASPYCSQHGAPISRQVAVLEGVVAFNRDRYVLMPDVYFAGRIQGGKFIPEVPA